MTIPLANHKDASSLETRSRPASQPIWHKPTSRGDHWSKLAICTGEDPNTFFPSNGDSGTRAREICACCPVRRNCAEYAAEADEFGIWGGLDQEQRRARVLELATNCANKSPVFSPEKGQA